MIVFQGELNEKNKKFLYKKHYKTEPVIWLIVSVIPIVLGLITTFWLMFIPMFIIVIVIMLLSLLIPEKMNPSKKLSLYLPQKIIIDEERISVDGITEDSYKSRAIEDVKDV
ncbi:MAG: hypothetical protein DBX59_07460 [Bacillota bacterium]|nr:MAG: hypothetical protein DBX59_07460 [Bacillota bacterium]